MAGTRGNHLLAVYVGIPSEIEDEFNKWYNTQHVPERLAIPGFQSAARYVSLEGTPKYMAFYELDHANVLEAPAYKRLGENSSDWDKRILANMQVEARTVYECIFTCGEAGGQHASYLLSVRLQPFPAKAYAIENKRLVPSGFRKHKVNRINNICILCH